MRFSFSLRCNFIVYVYAYNPVFCFLLAIGFLIGEGVRDLILGKKSLGWVPVAARIMVSKLKEEMVDPEAGGYDYKWELAYTYEYNGKEYRCERFSYKLPSNKKYHKNYPEGSEITAFCNPDNPAQAVIIPGRSIFRCMKKFLGASLLIFFIVLLILEHYGIVSR